MAKLLCTIGAGVLVAAEAFDFPGVEFGEVHCFTSTGSIVETSMLYQFFGKFPEVEFSVSRLSGFETLNNEADHAHFQEGLWRWYLSHLEDDKPLYVCLAGGFKSMSASMQKAAQLFGAAQVFHVLCENEPRTLPDLEIARKEGRIRFINLGPETGWEQLRQLKGRYSLDVRGGRDGRDLLLEIEGDDLSNEIEARMELAARKAAGWQQATLVPFPSLALLNREKQAWLDGPLDPKRDREWVRQLPKIELHSHLGGFATHPPLLDQVRAAAEIALEKFVEIPKVPKGWPLPPEPIGLETYCRLGDATGSALLSDPGSLRKQIELLYAHFQQENILYAEVRCSPANYRTGERAGWDQLKLIQESFEFCMRRAKERGEQFCQVNLIVIVTRRRGGDLSDISRHLALAITAGGELRKTDGCRVVGVDLAGFESRETRAEYFATDFDAAHRCGLAVTAHAGENDDVEGIWQAVYKLSARRIGHALHLRDSDDLMRTVAERGIGIEMCPYANVQIRGFLPFHTEHGGEYPLLDYLRSGIKVTVNTDNIGISDAGLSENLLLLADLNPGIRRIDLLKLQRNAVEVAFLSPREKETLLNQLDNEIGV